MMSERQPKSLRPENVTLRTVIRTIWADRTSKLFIIGGVIATLVVPLILAVTLPEEGTNQGFWLNFGHDWLTRGPATFVACVFCAVIALPLMVWVIRRRLRR